MSKLDDLTNRLAREAIAYRSLAEHAAVAEADYKRERGKAFLVARTEGGSVADADARVDSNPVVADLHMRRLTTAAVLDSQKELIRSLRDAINAEQTSRADMRAADVAMARGFGGAV